MLINSSEKFFKQLKSIAFEYLKEIELKEMDATKGKSNFCRSTKAWNQKMTDKDVILHKLYVDFKEASKKNPYSVKFKTDRTEEIINLHKIMFNNKCGGSENVEVVWDDDPSLNGCIQLLTISEKSEPSKEAKKILTIFIFHSRVVLGQGEYMMHYKEFVFPQIISQLSSEDLNPQTPKLLAILMNQIV